MNGLLRTSLALLLAGMLCAPVSANLRAPVIEQYRASSALAPHVQGLLVEREHLTIQLGKPYSGDLLAMERKPHKAWIEARYQVRAQEGFEGRFDFVMALPAETTEVTINGQPVSAAEVKPEERRVEEGRHKGEPLPPAAALVRFNGSLQTGTNEIRVRYSQPLGRHELDYGYFKTSRWASMVAYELWPLREWQRAPDFSLQIEVTAEDDSSVLRRLFRGDRYELALVAQDRDDAQMGSPFGFRGGEIRAGMRIPGGTVSEEDGALTLRHAFAASFPARVIAVVREK